MPTPSSAHNPTLLAWLDASAGHHAEFGDRLSNHLPMAAFALHRLGAAPARLQAWCEAYATRLQPAPPPEAWPAGDAWAAHLGRREAWPVYRDLFTQWLAQEGAGDVLEAVLPRLMEGCAGAAFHGLIRTAYATQSAHRQELADALAHWAAVWQPVPAAGDAAAANNATDTDPAAVLRRLPLPPLPVRGGLIADRVATVAAWPGFAEATAQLRIDGHTLQRLACGAAELYAASGNFTLLHLVTSAHAVRVLLPVLDDPLPAVQAYWRAFAAAWAASNARPGAAAPLQPWARIVAAAIAADDDHSAKLVDSCREQQRAYGGDVWRRAASRVVQAAARP